MFRMTAQDPTNTGPKFSVNTCTLGEISLLVATMRRDYPGYVITVVNQLNGMVHTILPGRSIGDIANYLS